MHVHAAFLALFGAASVLAQDDRQPAAMAPDFRPPAVPLVTHDPYFSVWSCADQLTDDWPRHWTRAVNAMCSMVRVDGQTYRIMGPQPKDSPAAKQASLTVTPTRTIYEFDAGGVRITLTFLTPLLPTDLELLSRPVTYLTWSVVATDGNAHDVSLYFDATAEWCVNHASQKVMPSRLRSGKLTLLRIGSMDQPVLARAGDDLRIDWGWFYLAVPRAGAGGLEDSTCPTVIVGHEAARNAFAKDGTLPDGDDLRFPRAANDDWPVMACAMKLDGVQAEPVTRTIMLAYDDQYSIEFFQRKLRPYWRREGMEFDTLIRTAHEQYPRLLERCSAFDDELTADLMKLGGEKYARLAVLAYRQTLAAHKLACGFDGTPLMFSKENFSNGCIATVDVIYPASPFFLALNPRLLEAQLLPVLEYARSPRWPHPFAPHDLGTYPLANGQVYGDGERGVENQMPVEESANMLLMLAALAKLDGKAALANRYFAQCKKWADYLDDEGFDPANQLCTDDFAGHLAHNTNLSIKAICALGAFAQICETLKKPEDAKTYRTIADEMAAKWTAAAADSQVGQVESSRPAAHGADGPATAGLAEPRPALRHYRLAFDKPGTWSQKYNLIWDRVLGLKLFPPELAAAETAFYRTKLGLFGLPLDNRATYTKLDWCVWTACLAPQRADFDAQIAPLYEFMNQTPQRVPLTDWFQTTDAKHVGFQARSVVGGVYMPLLCDAEVWKKWSTRK